MPTSFNPYREWLQLDERIERPTYYELLGIKPSETESRVIGSAADRAASKVRSHRPGPHAAEWAELLDEIAAAKKCLLDLDARREYDQKTLGVGAVRPKSSFASRFNTSDDRYPPGIGRNDAMQPWVPPSNTADPMAPLVNNVEAPRAGAIRSSSPFDNDPMAPLTANPDPPIPFEEHPAMQALTPAPPAPPTADQPPVVEPIVAVVSNRTRDDDLAPKRGYLRSIVTGAVAGVVLLVGLFFARVYLFRDGSQIAQQPPTQNSSSENPPNQPNNIDSSNEKLNETAVIESAKKPEQPEFRFTPEVLSPLASPPQTVAEPGNTSVNLQQAKSAATGNTPEIPEAKPAKPERQPPPAKPAAPEPKETKPAADSKSSTPENPAPEKSEAVKPSVSKQDLVKLGRAMQKTREAIGDHDFDLATEFIAIASKVPQLPEHTAKLERLELLLDAVKEYRKAIDMSVSKLEVGVTFEVNKTVVGVVEASRDRVVFRSGGRSLGYAIHELPPALAAVLAEQSLDQKDPATLIMKGAFIVASRKASAADRAKARVILEEAAAMNETAKALLPILDDSYDLAK